MAEKHSPLSLTQELAQIDERLVSLLASRTGLLSRAAMSRRAKNLSITDPNQEKTLWQVWRDSPKAEGLEPQMLRRIFHLANNLAYSRAENSSAPGKSLSLFPRRKPVNIDLDAPRDQILRSMTFFLGALGSTSLTVAPFQSNSISLELINALNLCGFNIAIQDRQCLIRPALSWSLDNKAVYAGQSTFHFYLLLCLALGGVNRVKYTGATKLKILDLRPVQELLPRLGCRLTIVEPHSNGLPVRVETSGRIPDSLDIPPGISRKFILALIAAATTFKKTLSIRLHESYGDSKLLRKGIAFLQHFLPEVQFDGSVVTIPAGSAGLDAAQMDIPVDPLMSLHLLVLPFFTDGQVTLRGKWPGYTPNLQDVMDILYEFGLRISIEPDSITSRMGDRPPRLSLDITSCQEYLPLLLAMAFGLRGACDIRLNTARIDVEHAQDLLEALGAGYSLQPGLLRLGLPSTRKPKEGPWQSPGPYWTLAGALISFTHPGVCLANADNISSAWPWFWKIFMNLPEPQHFIRSVSEGDDADGDADFDDAPKRRRIKVTGHGRPHDAD